MRGLARARVKRMPALPPPRVLTIDPLIKDAWHAMTPDQVLGQLNVTVDVGLDAAVARERLAQFGPNELTSSPRPSLMKLIIQQFEDRLVQILLGVAVCSAVLSIWEDDPTAFFEPLVILAILAINAAVGVWQGRSAEGALEALKRLQSAYAVVLRQGEWKSEVPARDLVPGDIVFIRVGDKVPADCRLLRLLSSTMNVDEGSLTGESVTVSKSVDPVEPNAPIQGKTNMVFAGTMVTVGNAYAVVTATSMNTEIGKIQQGVQQAKEEEVKTPLGQKLDEFGEQLSVIIGAVCLGVWLVNIPRFSAPAFGGQLQGALHYAKVAVALGVAAIPEGLPAVITLCLSLGTRRMAARNVIVRKLPSVETLGCTTVICTDKTGTLTTNQMTANALVHVTSEFPENDIGARRRKRKAALKEHKVEGVSYSTQGAVLGLEQEDMLTSAGLVQLKECAALCNDATILYDAAEHQFKHTGEPTEAALKVLAEKMTTAELGGAPNSATLFVNPAKQGGSDGKDGKGASSSGAAAQRPTGVLCSDTLLSKKWSRVATLEFNRDRKSMSVLVRRQPDNNGEARLYVKGAPEMLLRRCTKVLLPSGAAVPLTDEFREIIQRKVTEMAKRPLRCMGLAVKHDHDLPSQIRKYNGEGDVPSMLADPSRFKTVESQLTFLGLVGIKDPARPEVADAITKCKEAGIRVIMITGDSKATAVAIAHDVNVFEGDKSAANNPHAVANAFTGAEFFSGMTEGEQMAKLSEGQNLVFCRTEPMDKQKLVRMLQRLGDCPAMTGDGVNDAPALQQAAIGVAMGITGTEVSKEAADMILADDNFATIVAAVEEGRCIYNNMQAFICFLISCNFGEIATVFFATLLGLPEPLTPLQLLWVNLVTDGPPATALGFNPPDPDAMSKPPRDRSAPIMSPWLLTRYVATGLYVGCATIGILVWWFIDNGVTPWQLLHWGSCSAWGAEGFNPTGVDLLAEPHLVPSPCAIFSGPARAKAQTLSLSVLVCMEMLKALSAVSVNNSMLTMPPWRNKYLLVSVALPFLLHLGVLQYAPLARIFGLVKLTSRDWQRVAVCSLPILLLEELLKAIGRWVERKQTPIKQSAASSRASSVAGAAVAAAVAAPANPEA